MKIEVKFATRAGLWVSDKLTILKFLRILE